MRELDELSWHHSFFIGYVDILNRHKRLIHVDVSELVESTGEVRKKLEATELEGSHAELYGVIFEALLRAIETNNAMTQEEVLAQHKISKRISFTFRLLRLLTKVHGLAIKQEKEWKQFENDQNAEWRNAQ
jgi:Ni,Fe-hydrogenase maturation factor